MTAPRDSAVERNSHVGIGIVWMLAAVILFVCMDTTAKYLSGRTSVEMIVWGRYIFHAAILIPYLGRRLPTVARTGQPMWQIVRALSLFGVTALFYIALKTMPLVDALAVMFLAPILVTALSVPLLGESVGLRRWVSVGVGFCGVLIIVRPGMGVFQWAAVITLGAAFFHALQQVAVRRLNRTDGPQTTLLWTAVIGTVISSTLLPNNWQTPDSIDIWVLLVMLGFLGHISHFCLIRSYQYAQAAVVVPFSYTSLIWASAAGFILFSEVPDVLTITGALVIAGSGLYIMHREAVRGAPARPDVPPPAKS